MTRIATKLLLAYACITAISFILTALPLQLLVRRTYTNRALERFGEALAAKHDELAEADLKGDRVAMDIICDEINTEFSGRVSLISRDGSIAADSISARCIARARPECIPAIRKHREETLSRYMPLDDTLTVRLPLTIGNEPMTARLALPLKPVRTQMHQVHGLLTVAALAGIALAIGVGYAISRRIASPVEEMTTAAERTAGGDLDVCIVPRGHDEIGRLGMALERMRQSLTEMIRDLRYERDQAITIVNTMSEALIALNSEGSLLFSNRAAQALFPGLSSRSGNSLPVGCLPDLLSGAVEEVLRNGGQREFELGDVRKDHHVFRATVTAAGQAPNGVVVVLSDITEARRTQILGRELVSNASHELRTPLTIAASTAETLLRELETPRGADHQHEFLEVIGRQLRRMELLIDEILQLSRLEAGPLGRENEETDLNEIAADVCLQAREQAAGKGLDLNVQLAPEAIMVRGEERLLNMAVSNLVDNAIRYIGHGTHVVLRTSQETDGNCLLQVEDDGPGITPAEREHIFERFVRGRTAMQSGIEGSGLGLAIVHRVVELHGGTVDVESNAAGGSTFSIRLPAAGPAAV